VAKAIDQRLTERTRFGSAGFYVESRMDPQNVQWDLGTKLAIQGDDKIVASRRGRYGDPVAWNDFWVTRVLADESAYDPAYGSAGLGHANFAGSSAAPESPALGSDGKAVVAG
jgi:hypothetical protein